MRIAITGGIAEGKSTVLRYCAAAGYKTASSDEVAREVFDFADVQVLLAELLQSSGPVDRATLRTRLALAPALRREINKIMHPRILQALREKDAQIWEVPLLIETCIHDEFDRIWVATCGPEEQLSRLVARIGNEELAQRLLSTQLPSRAKCAFADRIIRTNERESRVQQYVLEALRRDLD